MAEFASGKYALGICDRCGLSFKLKELKWEVTMRKRTGMRVCDPCNDPDHPQQFINEVHVEDPQGLRDPRPDTFKS